MVDRPSSLPVRLHSGIDTFCLPWQWRARDATANLSYPKTLFSKLCVHKQCSQCTCSCVQTLVILRAKFHVVSILLRVLKIVILMLTYKCPCTPLKISLPEEHVSGDEQREFPLKRVFAPSLHRSKLYQTAPLKDRSPLTWNIIQLWWNRPTLQTPNLKEGAIPDVAPIWPVCLLFEIFLKTPSLNEWPLM